MRSYFLKRSGVKDDWLSNWAWTVGVSFRLGGTPSKSQYEQAAAAAAAAQRYLMGGLGGFSQFYLEGRASFQSRWTRNLRLVPQATLGLSATTTAMVGVNAQYHALSESDWIPYAGLGIGALVRGGEIDDETGTTSS